MAGRTFPNLRQFAKMPPSHAEPLSVCVVTSEFLGPIKNGGIGTATSGLIENLSATGHHVTVLYTQVLHSAPHCVEHTWEYWVEIFRSRGIELEYIPHTGTYADWREKAWLVKEFLRTRSFDIVYFNEHHGSGYYALAAKKAGIEPYTSQLQCLITHGSIEWVSNINDQPLQTERDLEMLMLERRSVEMVDYIIGPSAYLLNEYISYGWKLPPNTLVQPYVLSRKNLTPPPLKPIPVTEIVFFGRLEVRKGLWVFCEALDRIKNKIGNIPVTFLGRMTDLANVPTGQYIMSRAMNWNFNFQIVTSAGQSEALERLRKPGRLAVMPSTADNSPCVVYECLQHRIPFITGAGSGADEIVDRHRSPWALVPPTAEDLSKALVDAIENGARPALPAFDYEENWAAWENWHRWVSTNKRLQHKKTTRSRAGNSNSKAILIFDDGELSSTELIKNIANNSRALQKADRVIMLSQRRSPLLQLLNTLIADVVRKQSIIPQITLLSVHDVGAEELYRILADSRIIVGLDAGLEVHPNFISNADRILANDDAHAIVCSVQDEDTSDLQLPFGNAGGIAILSEAISAGVWAVNLQKTKQIVHAVPFVEDRQNLLCTAREYGEILLRRICTAGATVALDTNIGATAIKSAHRVERNTHTWYQRTLKLVDDIGLSSLPGISLPTWQVVSVAAQKRAQASFDRENLPVLNSMAIDNEYPHIGSGPPHEVMAKRAAFFGDLAQGIQILAAHGPVDSRAQMTLINTALAERLRSTPFQFQDLSSWPGLFTLDVNPSYGFVPMPAGFIIHPNPTGAKQATVVVVAVPLQRYHALDLGLRLKDERATADVKLSISVFEEVGGHQITTKAFIVRSQEWEHVSLALPPIAASAVFQFCADIASSGRTADYCALELGNFNFRRSVQ
jgi:glycosyltransferase involved in cell wall biosynthesis